MRSQLVANTRPGSARLNSGQAATIARSRLDKVSQSGSVSKARSVTSLSPQVLGRLKERPRLIAELSDSHRSLNGMMMAVEQLKIIARSLVLLRSLVESAEQSPHSLNQIDIEKRRIMDAVSQRLFGRYVLDSSFAPVIDGSPEIAFTIAGLDMVRERLTNELVTLYINNRMVPLAFDRVASDESLLRQFAVNFAFGHMRLQLDEAQALQISMSDLDWRNWDQQIYISGQGGRYPQGAPIKVQAQSLYPTVELITMLDINAKEAIAVIDKVLERVNEMHKKAVFSLKSQQHRADKLLGFCHSASADTGQQIKTLFEQNPLMALRAVQKHYLGPNRENVISLMKK